MKFTEVSIFIKIAFGVIIVMFLFDIIGFATSSWVGSGNTHGGLWEYCVSSACIKYIVTDTELDATRAFEVLGFLAALAALIVIVLYLFVPPLADKDILKLVTMIICFVACFLILLGVIIFATRDIGSQWKFRYSFVLTILAGILALVGGILVLVDKVMK